MVGGGLVLLMVALLSASSFLGTYSYRRLVRGLSCRAAELPLASDLDDLLQQVVRIECAGRIVGVDQNNGACAVADLAADVGQVGQPAGTLVADVMTCSTPRQYHCCRPQRVVRCRDEYLIPIIQERLHGHHDEL
jgi:hypothetical protein